jgi:exopolysaccharide transport family protein
MLQRGGIDIREFLRILRRRLIIVIATPIILVAAAVVFIKAVQPLYTATATVLIDLKRANVADPDRPPVPANLPTDDAAVESQVMLIHSVAVLQRVVETLKLTEDPEFTPQPGILDPVLNPIRRMLSTPEPDTDRDPEATAKARSVELLQKRLKVERQRTTFLADIYVSAWDATKAARIANAIADSYFIEQVRSKYDATKIANDWLNRQIEDLRTRVVDADNAVADFRAANNLIAAQGVTVNDQQITDLNNKLIEARAQTAEARAKYDQARAIADSRNAGAISEALSSETITRLRAQYGELTKNAADLSSRYGRRHPLVTAAIAQVRDTEQRINEEISRILEGRRHEFEVAEAREQSLRKSLEDLQDVSTVSGQAQVRLRELQRQADSSRILYESFLARYKETSAQESLEMPDARIVTRAEVPIRPSFPRPLLTIAFALVLGVALGGVLAMVADYIDPRIKSLQQAEVVTGIPSIAAIPIVNLRELARLARRGRRELQGYDPKLARLLPAAMQPPLLRYAIDQPTSIFAEAVRAVRLAVQHAAQQKRGAARGERGQITMVTSAVDGEGKTTLATNLAFSFAMMGVRTILVEGDLRSPALTRALCPRAPTGLVEVATDKTPLHQSILVDQSTSLSILPAPSPSNSGFLAEFVFSNGMSAILQELRRHYDMVIVDAPPLIPLVDGRMLGEYADHIILAARWDRTPQDLLSRAVDHLEYVQDRVIGTVLTQVDLRQAGLYDHYFGSSYYRYYDFTMRARSEPAA